MVNINTLTDGSKYVVVVGVSIRGALDSSTATLFTVGSSPVCALRR